MECFYHEGRPAVGSCRSCFRGLCRTCAVCLFVGTFVLSWGLSLPRYREISLLGLPFLAIGGLLLVVTRNVRRARNAASKPAG